MAKRPFSTPFSTILTARLARRAFLKGSLAATVASVFPLAGCATPTARSMPMGFTAIPASSDDALKVPPEYDATVLFRWGDPVGVAGNMPAFRPDASNSAADQAVQAGMHHDGMWFHPLPVRHRYVDSRSARDEPRISRRWAAVHRWRPDLERREGAQGAGRRRRLGDRGAPASRSLGSRPAVETRAPDHRLYAMRDLRTGGGLRHRCAPLRIPPAARCSAPTTAAPMAGRRGGRISPARRTGSSSSLPPAQRRPTSARYGIGKGRGYKLGAPRRAVRRGEAPERGEPLRLGGRDRSLRPAIEAGEAHRARTHQARGRMPGLGARSSHRVLHGRRRELRVRLQVRRGEAMEPRQPEANRTLLDEGTLYAARFDADGSGVWLPLVHGVGPLTAANGFRTRRRCSSGRDRPPTRVGATPMDRPEWCAVHPVTREVYVTLTNNTARGREKLPGPDAANPRANNLFGQIVRWRETGDDPTATAFNWDLFALAGVPENADPANRGKHQGRRVRLPRRPVVRRARRAVGADRHLAHHASTMASSRRSATTRCSPPIRPRGEFQRFPHRAARLRGHRPSRRRRTAAPASSTSSTRARTAGESNDPEEPRAIRTGPTSGPTAGHARRRS